MALTKASDCRKNEIKKISSRSLEKEEVLRNVTMFFVCMCIPCSTLSTDTSNVHFGASLSRISSCVLSLFTFCHNSKTNKLILENASTNFKSVTLPSELLRQCNIMCKKANKAADLGSILIDLLVCICSLPCLAPFSCL